jgi:transposase
VGPITAVALAALAPPAGAFRKGRDFAAWVGLTPLQHSSGGKQKLGTTSKMGGANAAAAPDHRSEFGGAQGGQAGHCSRVLARADAMLVIVALANKMARIAWAVQAKGEGYRAPAVVA